MIDRPFVKESDVALPEVDAVFEGDEDNEGVTGFVPFVPKERLMRSERETSIGGDAEERIAGVLRVFSNDPVWVNRFLKKGYKPYDISGDSHFFKIPVKAITVRSAAAIENAKEAAQGRTFPHAASPAASASDAPESA